jgi:hypothetical protein
MNIDILQIGINISKTIHLNNKFNNLPINLKIINFGMKINSFDEFNSYQKIGKFNFLFNIKIPNGCDFIVSMNGIKYDAKYTGVDRTLELIKKIPQTGKNLICFGINLTVKLPLKIAIKTTTTMKHLLWDTPLNISYKAADFFLINPSKTILSKLNIINKNNSKKYS